MKSVRKGSVVDIQFNYSELRKLWEIDKTIFCGLKGRRISPWYLDSGVSQVAITEAPPRLRHIRLIGEKFTLFAEYSGRDHFGRRDGSFDIDSAKGITFLDVSLEQLSSLRALLDKEREEENEELLVSVS